MADLGSDLNCAISSEIEEKSWCLLGILMKMGRPGCPEELASQCKIFTVAPDYIRFISSIPNSPLQLMENGFVTISKAVAYEKFVSVVTNDGSVSKYRSWSSQPKRLVDNNVTTYFRKRKGTMLNMIESSTAKRRLLLPFTEGESELPITNGIQDFLAEKCVGTANIVTKTLPTIKFESENSGKARISLHLDTNGKLSGCPARCGECREPNYDGQTSMFPEGEISGSVYKSSNSFFVTGRDLNCQKPIEVDRFLARETSVNFSSPTTFQYPFPCEVALGDIRNKNERECSNTSCHEDPEQNNTHLMDDGICRNHTCIISTREYHENGGMQMKSGLKDALIENGAERAKPSVDMMSRPALCGDEPGDIKHALDEDDRNITCTISTREYNENGGMQMESGSKDTLINYGAQREKPTVDMMVKPALCKDEPRDMKHALRLDEDDTVKSIETRTTFQKAQSSFTPNQLHESSYKLEGAHKNDLCSKPQILKESLDHNKFDNTPKSIDQKFVMRNKLKRSNKPNVHAKENIAETTFVTPKVEKKTYPSIDTFSIEQEEGSGGYGTVYRARRKNDGKSVAIKCPHDNAKKSHVSNEGNMLERFGGRNFIIKFEGSFQNGTTDCFVLEHVEHDKPEVLKREIDIFHLQWYGYCMFRALACLHKEGVVHRDVKPGNFLFSRKLNKGYLIDFNLAMDLKQKYSGGSKSKSSLGVSNKTPLPSNQAPSVKEKNLGGIKSLSFNQRASADSKPDTELNRKVKQKPYTGPLKNCPNKASEKLFRAQKTDGSGLTSAKDVTSTRTPSTERPREPLPFLGRKELISLVQDSMRSPDHNSIKGPASQRKRVAAPSGKIVNEIVYLTPMPLPSSTAGLLRSKVDGKQKREGSCVGTKGFRAPEVLLRSLFQGPKIDIWSAGVTLLYLMIGKAPFTGDPEQNIKDIAKLRGSEDLWELAKLHDRELSFPVLLYDERYLQSLDLEIWCKIHTKRTEFFEHIPKALFDLVDKCLKVNPRLRISAEEALKHEFFASCHESLRKQRMIRRGISSDSSVQTSHLVDRLCKV